MPFLSNYNLRTLNYPGFYNDYKSALE